MRMRTLELIQEGRLQIPMTVSWHLSDLGRSQGLQDFFARQSPQKLKVLREHAIAQSAVSSNRIEGVEVEQARVGTIVFGHPTLRDRDEEEIAGYRDALKLIHAQRGSMPVSEETILRLHKLSRGDIWDAGKYKDKPVDIIEKLPGGGEKVRFRSVSPAKTPEFTRRLVSLWQVQSREHRISPLIVMAAFNLDFLCIHPFRDGNGRVSRLLLLLTAYHVGIDVGRYISLERVIEDSKERYYETLKESSQGWHEGKHDPWPYISYLLYTLKQAYSEFERRADQLKSPRGAKTELITAAIRGLPSRFSLVDVERACPGVSRDMVRKVMKDMRKQRMVTCAGRGPGAVWERR